MKRYKHKETFTVVLHESVGKYTVEHWGKLDPINNTISLNFDFNNGDWMEIKERIFGVSTMKEEPNYLITAFRGTTHKKIRRLFPNGKYGFEECGGHCDIRSMTKGSDSLEDGLQEIYSVKNSKGEEFTVSDMVDTTHNKRIEIKSFNLRGDKMEVITNIGNTFLDFITKSKTPIFVSADGKEMHEGDKYYVPQVTHRNNKFELDGTYLEITVDIYCKATTNKFSTKELAQEYIDSNKPIFVSADNVEFYKQHLQGDYSLFSVLPKANWQETRYRLKELVNFPKKEWLHFHTKEARQEYIDNNKPKYSLADIGKAIIETAKKTQYLSGHNIFEELKQLGK